jgi:hypothetical protein
MSSVLTGGSNSVVECQLPKLDVAGSTPVSRSNFSITWEESKIKRYSVYSVFSLNLAEPPVRGCPPSPESRVSLWNHLGFEALRCIDLLLYTTD